MTSQQLTLGSVFLLPESIHRSIYYIALITEICKLSPQTVGPAVGKSIRKLYGLLSDGLDVEVAHRFADWFSVHMSNFGFAWVWKEWYVPSCSLSEIIDRVTDQGPGHPAVGQASKTAFRETGPRIRDPPLVLRQNFKDAAGGHAKPGGAMHAGRDPWSRVRLRRSL